MRLRPVMFPPRPRQAGDESCPHRITSTGHHDRERVCGVLGRTCRCGSYGHNYRHVEPDQLSCQVGEPLVLPLRPTVFDDEVLAFDIAEFTQPLPEGIDRRVAIRAGKARTEPPDPMHFHRLLRLGSERCGQEAESESDQDSEGTALHGAVLQHVPQDHRPEGCPAPV